MNMTNDQNQSRNRGLILASTACMLLLLTVQPAAARGTTTEYSTLGEGTAVGKVTFTLLGAPMGSAEFDLSCMELTLAAINAPKYLETAKACQTVRTLVAKGADLLVAAFDWTYGHGFTWYCSDLYVDRYTAKAVGDLAGSWHRTGSGTYGQANPDTNTGVWTYLGITTMAKSFSVSPTPGTGKAYVGNVEVSLSGTVEGIDLLTMSFEGKGHGALATTPITNVDC